MRFGQPLSFGEVPHTNPTVVPTQIGKQQSSCHLQTLQLFPRSCGLPEGAWSVEYCIKHDYSAECLIQRIETLQLFPTAYKPYNCSRAAAASLSVLGLDCRILNKTRLFCRTLDTMPTTPTVVPYRLQTLQLFPRSCDLPEGAWSAEYSRKHDYSAECSIQRIQTLQFFPTAYKPYSCSRAAAASLRVLGVQNTL